MYVDTFQEDQLEATLLEVLNSAETALTTGAWKDLRAEALAKLGGTNATALMPTMYPCAIARRELVEQFVYLAARPSLDRAYNKKFPARAEMC